jgi:predicted phosphodiesterase
MILLVISDLHIDTGGKLGTFGWKARKFIDLLDSVINYCQVDKVVLNGDIFDLYKCSYSEIERANKKIIRYFKEKGFVFIRGNHDLWVPYTLDHYDIVNSSGFPVHVEHGHKADFLNGTRLGEAISFTMYAILKLLVRFRWVERTFFRTVNYIDDVNRIPRKYNTFKYLVYALKLLKNYDMIILGHTHKLESHKIYYLNHKKIYLNCGTCSLGRFQGVLVDTETLDYETIKVGRKSKLILSELPVLRQKG